jgi:hypothetical protein
MDHLLSVSQASRLAGVPRRLIQQHIQQGEIEAFEGHIRMSELRKVYPEVSGDRSGMVEKVRRIRDAAASKANRDFRPSVDHLCSELQRAKVEVGRLQEEVAGYRQFAAETERRLLELQDRCDKRQAMLLGTLIGWFMNQHKLREGR